MAGSGAGVLAVASTAATAAVARPPPRVPYAALAAALRHLRLPPSDLSCFLPGRFSLTLRSLHRVNERSSFYGGVCV